MFNVARGVVGIKVDAVNNANIRGIKIRTLSNRGEITSFVCDNAFYLWRGLDYLGPVKNPRYAGADVRGLQITRAFETKLEDVEIDELFSLEGRAVGLDLNGDRPAESGFAVSRPYVTTNNVRVGSKLLGGKTGFNSAVEMSTQFSNFGGVKTSPGSQPLQVR